MKKGLFFLLPLLFSVFAQADLVTNFKKVNSKYKGPFGFNVLQGTENRKQIKEGGSPRGGALFQAAFRNEMARELVEKDGFYLANLFTTNYYELMGEYVFGDTYGSHPVDHAALLARRDQAMPKAAVMVRHWILEKYYVSKFPETYLSKSFKLRGISSTENELEYATYFFNFYLSSLQNDFEFLPAFLLMKGSPVGQIDSLNQARDLASYDYEYLSSRYGTQDPMIKRVYQIRNAVHNQMSEDIIADIDRFFREYPGYRRSGYTGLIRVQEILRQYFQISSKKVSEVAGKAGLAAVKSWSDKISKQGASVENLHGLSVEVAAAKLKLTDRTSIATEKKTQVLSALSVAAQYLNKEITSQREVTSNQVIETVVNLAFTEGFLIKDNWEYFLSEVRAARDVKAASAVIPDLINIATDTLDQALGPAFQQWLSIEPKMQSFVDNTIKSSSLSVATITLGKIRK